MELGPWDGRDTIILATFCEAVTCIEAREENIAATQEALDQFVGVCNVRFVQDDLESCKPSRLGDFDLVFASGVLYHLQRPWDLIAKIAKVTGWALGWTHLAERVDATVDGREGYWWNDDVTSRLGGLSDKSFWLTPDAFAAEWRAKGFQLRYFTPPAPHFNGGLAAQFSARRIKI